MPENITTVLNLPDADFGSGGFPSPADNRVYILQGEGSDRDRKAPLGDLFDWLVGAKAMTNDSPQHRVGDIVFKIEETQGGKILTAYIMDGRTLSKPTVTGGLKADSIEGTNQGTGDTKYLVLGNTTVTGDLDAKGKAMLGNSMLVADPDEQTLESRVPLGFGDGYQAGKELVRTDEVKTAKISSPGTTIQVLAVLDAFGVKGNVTTDSIVPKTAGQPISVTGSLSISGNVSLTGATAAVSAKSVATERLACSKLSLASVGCEYAPVLPYYVDMGSSEDNVDLSSLCAAAPAGGRVTLVNASGGSRKYQFTSQYQSGYFTLKNGRAVDLLVSSKVSTKQVLLSPIGIDFSTGDA